MSIRLILLCVVLAISLIFILYFAGFKLIGQERRIDLFTIDSISKIPIREKITLRFSRGWQVRSAWLSKDAVSPIGKVKLSIKNHDNTPLRVILPIDSEKMSPLSEGFIGFNKQLQPGEQQIIYDGELSNFVNKIIWLNNDKYLKTSFDLIVEFEEEVKVINPIQVFAFIPSGTL